MGLALAFAGVVILALMAWIRLAPVDVAQWHVDLVANRPADTPITLVPPGGDIVRRGAGHAWLDASLTPDEARQMLARLDAIAVASPNTRRLAGSVDEGRITWESRSSFWGFADYTTSQITPMGLTAYARLRFGRSDFGVNASRLRDWLSQL